MAVLLVRRTTVRQLSDAARRLMRVFPTPSEAEDERLYAMLIEMDEIEATIVASISGSRQPSVAGVINALAMCRDFSEKWALLLDHDQLDALDRIIALLEAA